jgi:hypothetical protein
MIMALYHRVEQILEALRPVSRRQATFEWFILLLWGVLLISQPPAITSQGERTRFFTFPLAPF